tara:strand:+ start:28419 stop:29177 length:759 start_codon:yes stop_codon:yes gene_type:complete
MNKLDPFIKQKLGTKHKQSTFDSLKISTATLDVRMRDDVNINFVALFNLLKIYDGDDDGENYPGKITGAKYAGKIRGKPPNTETKGFKNATLIWIWLVEKKVNIKITCHNFHVTGCKSLTHAPEATRYLQQHLQLISQSHKIFDIFPHAIRIDVHMNNYNFSLGVGISLPDFDIYIMENFNEFLFSAYDQNIHKTSMTIRIPELQITYTVNDNGQISICASEHDLQMTEDNARKGHLAFYYVFEEYRKDLGI